MYGVDSQARLIPGATIHIVGDEARHAVQVARLKTGERVRVGNGHGIIAHVEATAVSPGDVSAVVIDVTHHPAPTTPLWLVQALAKGSRDEQAIEQAVELGVTTIVPWQAARSVSVWRGDRAEKGQARWSRLAHEAAKQSLAPWWPRVAPLHTTAQLREVCDSVSMVILDPDSPSQLTGVVAALPEAFPIALVVGPEGGISGEEKNTLVEAGAVTARMGPTVLRTSTAGPIALALTMSARQMWEPEASISGNL